MYRFPAASTPDPDGRCPGRFEKCRVFLSPGLLFLTFAGNIEQEVNGVPQVSFPKTRVPERGCSASKFLGAGL